MAECNLKEITLDGVKYLRADQVSEAAKPGKRYILVLDRGWIFCADLSDENGRIKGTRVVHVRSWSSIGFDGLVDSGGRGSSVVTKKFSRPLDTPSDSELFRISVDDNWGL